jgi:hypothetical protein
VLVGLVAVTVVAYAVLTISWIVHEVNGGAWARWLELTYLVGLIVWLGGFALTLVVRKWLRQAEPRTVIGDERTGALFLRAHQLSLVTVVLAQVPFFFIAVPAQVLAQFTVTTAVVSLFAMYAWLDR